MRLGVCGWPVAHSLSPRMHNAALEALGLGDEWRYQKLPIPPDAFAETVRALPAEGFAGVNVTIPHKEAALALADRVTETARAVGAANTLSFGPAIEADNTDVQGLLDAIAPVRQVAGARALVLGAGGAGRAAVHALVGGGAEDVMVWNRTPARAERLCRELGGRPVLAPEPADLIVQCTSVGLKDGSDPFKALPLDADTFGAGICVVDLVYRAGGTPFLAAASSRGADVVSGLEILVGQGAAALERWTGRPAPRDVMRRAVTETR